MGISYDLQGSVENVDCKYLKLERNSFLPEFPKAIFL